MFGLIFLSKQIPIVAKLNQIPRVNINTMKVFRSSVRLSPVLNLFLVLTFSRSTFAPSPWVPNFDAKIPIKVPKL